MGYTLPITGMYVVGEVFAITDCLVVVTGRVNCTYCTPGFGPQSLHTITLLLSRALAVARA